MSKVKRAGLQLARGILALFTVLWALSLAGVVTKTLTEPELMLSQWPRLILAILVTLLPAWGYIKLTKKLKSKDAEKN